MGGHATRSGLGWPSPPALDLTGAPWGTATPRPVGRRARTRPHPRPCARGRRLGVAGVPTGPPQEPPPATGGGHRAGDGAGRHPQDVQSTAPVELVGEVRNDDRRRTCPDGGTRRAGAAVVNDGPHPPEQLVVGFLRDGQQVRVAAGVRSRDLHEGVNPEPGADLLQTAHQGVWVGLVHRSEADVDPLATVVEGLGHGCRERPRGSARRPPPGHGAVRGAAGHELRAEGVERAVGGGGQRHRVVGDQVEPTTTPAAVHAAQVVLDAAQPASGEAPPRPGDPPRIGQQGHGTPQVGILGPHVCPHDRHGPLQGLVHGGDGEGGRDEDVRAVQGHPCGSVRGVDEVSEELPGAAQLSWAPASDGASRGSGQQLPGVAPHLDHAQAGGELVDQRPVRDEGDVVPLGREPSGQVGEGQDVTPAPDGGHHDPHQGVTRRSLLRSQDRPPPPDRCAARVARVPLRWTRRCRRRGSRATP